VGPILLLLALMTLSLTVYIAQVSVMELRCILARRDALAVHHRLKGYERRQPGGARGRTLGIALAGLLGAAIGIGASLYWALIIS